MTDFGRGGLRSAEIGRGYTEASRSGGMAMAQIAVDEQQLKQIVQTAVVEALEQRPEIFQEAVREVLEDFALARAIEEGTKGDYVDRAEVWQALEAVE
jgi:hypothetical protein